MRSLFCSYPTKNVELTEIFKKYPEIFTINEGENLNFVDINDDSKYCYFVLMEGDGIVDVFDKTTMDASDKFEIQLPLDLFEAIY